MKIHWVKKKNDKQKKVYIWKTIKLKSNGNFTFIWTTYAVKIEMRKYLPFNPFLTIFRLYVFRGYKSETVVENGFVLLNHCNNPYIK